MFIKLNFRSSIGKDKPHLRIIKISRIQEVRPDDFKNGSEIQLSGEKRFHRVVESVEEIFGIIEK
jgi:hypothetical protein